MTRRPGPAALGLATFMSLVCYANPVESDLPVTIGTAHPPDVGESLFDEIFLDRGSDSVHYDVPYPFDDLVLKLESLLGKSVNGDQGSVSSVLLPLGRCINRYAASPEFFRYPRIVLSGGTEDHGGDGDDLPFLKDRLFIGFQEKARALEVISYNEAAGRFEFQIVRNYAENAQPAVDYADRKACTGCHQNHGPIFSRAPWDETDNNREIFDLLAGALGDPGFEPPVFRGSDAADVDRATNRANKLAMYQRFWREACRSRSEHDAIRCRAGLVETVVSHRLQERSRVLPVSPLVSEYFVPQTLDIADEIWPQGISIPSSDIINENPLENGIDAHLRLADHLYRPRSWQINWQPENIYSMIQGLGDFIPLKDMRKLDDVLFKVASQTGSPIDIAGRCRLKSKKNRDEFGHQFDQSADMSVACDFEGGGFGARRRFLGNILVESGKISSLPVFSRMVLDSDNVILGLTHDGGRVISEQDDWVIRLDVLDSKHKFRARIPGVGAIREIEFRWPRSYSSARLFAGTDEIEGTAVLSLVNEYSAMNHGISKMIRNSDKGEQDFLSSKSFRGRAVVKSLISAISQLGREQ